MVSPIAIDFECADTDKKDNNGRSSTIGMILRIVVAVVIVIVVAIVVVCICKKCRKKKPVEKKEGNSQEMSDLKQDD